MLQIPGRAALLFVLDHHRRIARVDECPQLHYQPVDVRGMEGW
jgi:hypothetical protein